MNIQNKYGLKIEFLDNGSIKSIEDQQIRINLKSSSPFAPALSNIFLRKRGSSADWIPLTGPLSKSEFSIQNNVFYLQGQWEGFLYSGKLELSPESKSWRWSISLQNNSGQDCDADLILVQDIGLKAISNNLVNEYYVSQYIERIILKDPQYGSVVCCRQNVKEPSGYPWILIASAGYAASATTDGIQFFGNTYRSEGIPQALTDHLPGCDLAGESSIVALQEEEFILKNGETKTISFVATFIANHPEATSTKDLMVISKVLEEFPVFNHKEFNSIQEWKKAHKNIFNSSRFMPVEKLTDAEIYTFFGNSFRHLEIKNGETLSFFTREGNHVVLEAKETLVDRPHGHILQAKTGFEPTENVMSSTCYATGIFNSHLSQGNTNFNVLLSINTSQFNLQTDSGQRIFIQTDDELYLLGIPSAFEMGLNHCRWIYKYNSRIYQIRTWTSVDHPVIYTDFKVLAGDPVSLLISHQMDHVNTWKVNKNLQKSEYTFLATDGMITGKFADAQFRLNIYQPGSQGIADVTSQITGSENRNQMDTFLVLRMEETPSFFLRFTGELQEKHSITPNHDPDLQWIADRSGAVSFWDRLSLGLKINGSDEDSLAINEILPWYGNNALVHFLTPYGLEQFSGAAWGTRDVAQGPIELLLQTEKYEEARKVLMTVFQHQNPFGDWPQWWMFDSYKAIRASDCHGDIYYWVLIALANYVKTTGDLSILEEKLPYFGDDQTLTPVAEHVERLINMITESYIEGTSFVPFGGGDWNDSLQPVNSELSKKLISAWTVEMNYQSFMAYRDVYIRSGEETKAEILTSICENIRKDFNQYLIKDGVLAGYGHVEADGRISLLLHPSDKMTGIRYSLLPMNRGIISGIFTKKQADDHQKIIDQWLKGPDGARLMDKPLRYKGGIQEIFQRAESSTFFGREIGLMYVHEHIRYAESQAILGKADEFVKALRQAIPVDYQKIVDCGDLRQANCYYSSSDVSFHTRYEADEKYQEIIDGRQLLKGGWRVYSSGPGIYISLVISRLLGIRLEADRLIIDPVIPKKMDGLSASFRIKSHNVNLKYRLLNGTYNPKRIRINGNEIPFTIYENPYRDGGAVINLNYFLSRLNLTNNMMEIEM